MSMSPRRSILLVIALTTAALAHAGTVANLTCTGSQGVVSMNLSYFSIGAALTNPASSAGPTQNTLMPLNLHAALSSFEKLFQAVAAGVPFTSCALNTQGSNGGAIQFTFNSVFVSNVTAAATAASAMAPRTAYVDATLLYSSIAVTQAGNTVDDGGTSTPPGWDIGKNNPS
ncbi:MAG TPA: hypothetical protein VGI90_07520 [Steroidobacteraceae bacterium]|jgi:hypothetical protein